MNAYHQALTAAQKAGVAHATDAGLMALFCATSLQLLVGAASPELVWRGAQSKGMTALELATLATYDAAATHELMWL